MHAHPTRTLLTLLALIVLIIGFVYTVFFSGFIFPRQVTQQVPEAQGFPSDAPAPTPQDYVAAQKGFQYLIAYTDGGFIPQTLAVKKGERVRFTNNSDSPLRLSLERAQVAPLNHGEYYEYTFANAGTFIYSDGTNKVAVTVN